MVVVAATARRGAAAARFALADLSGRHDPAKLKRRMLPRAPDRAPQLRAARSTPHPAFCCRNGIGAGVSAHHRCGHPRRRCPSSALPTKRRTARHEPAHTPVASASGDSAGTGGTRSGCGQFLDPVNPQELWGTHDISCSKAVIARGQGDAHSVSAQRVSDDANHGRRPPVWAFAVTLHPSARPWDYPYPFEASGFFSKR